jgi:hypothetical protein
MRENSSKPFQGDDRFMLYTSKPTEAIFLMSLMQYVSRAIPSAIDSIKIKKLNQN